MKWRLSDKIINKERKKLFYSIHIVQQRSTHYYIIRFESVVILRTVQTLELIILSYMRKCTQIM